MVAAKILHALTGNGVGSSKASSIEQVTAKQRVGTGKIVVEPEQEVVFVLRLGNRLQILGNASAQFGSVRLRINRDNGGRGRTDANIRQACAGVAGHTRSGGARQEPVAGVLVGNSEDGTDSQRLVQSFIIGEKESLIFLERATNRGSVLIAMKRWRPRSRIEIVAGVHRTIAGEQVIGSMPVIRSRPTRHDSCRAEASVLSVVGVSENLKFRDGFHSQR